MNIEWPYNVQKYLSFFSYFTDFTGQILSYDCIFYEMGVFYKSIYMKTIISVILPIMIYIYTFFHYTIKKLITGKAKIRKVYISVIVLHIFCQPMIVKQLLENFNCVQINNDNFLVAQMDIRCNDEQFEKWVEFITKI